MAVIKKGEEFDIGFELYVDSHMTQTSHKSCKFRILGPKDRLVSS